MLTNQIKISISVENKKQLQAVFSAILVESKSIEITRGNIQIEISGIDLIIIIQASDLVATRALTNSIMRLVKTSLDITQLIY